jgi:hypothetical protein
MKQLLLVATLVAIVTGSSGCVRSRPPLADGICAQVGCPTPRAPELERRARAIESAMRGRLLQSVTLETLGCFGTCPPYRVEFFSNGRASIDLGPGLCKASATVPFGHIAYAVRLAPGLLPDYPTGGVIDGFGARISLQMSDGTTSISAGLSESSWDRAFAITESRLDQIVRDTRWSPPIDRRPCLRALGR